MTSGVPVSRPAAADVKAALPRTARLIKPADFKRVFKNNQASNDRLFRILARANPVGRPRLGMAVSKKVDRTAVGRNRIKRIIRESFRRWSVTGNGEMGFDIVVLPRPVAATTGNQQLFRSLADHWSRIEKAADGEKNGSGIVTEETEN